MSTRIFSKISGWSFVFKISAILLVLLGFLSLDHIVHTIKALSSDTDFINLYPTSIQPQNQSDDYASGWWNTDKASSSPDLAPTSGMSDFSDVNSAFFNGGNANLVLGRFSILNAAGGSQYDVPVVKTDEELESEKLEEEELESEELESEKLEEEETESEGAESEKLEDGEMGNEELISEKSEEELESEKLEGEEIKSERLEDFEIEQGEVEVFTPGDSGSGEVIIEEAEDSAETGDNPADASTESGAVSYFDSIRGLWQTQPVQAEGESTDEVSDFADLGEFKKAKINFSFAMAALKAEHEAQKEPEIGTTSEPVEPDMDSIVLEDGNAEMIIWYAENAVDEQGNLLWQKLDTLSGGQISNALHEGYFSYEAPWLGTWDDVRNLQIKFESVENGEIEFTAYLDSFWVEAEFLPISELEKIERRQRWEEALDLISDRLVFRANEDGRMKFRYNKNEERIWETLGEILGLGNFWEDVNITADLIDSRGIAVDLPLTFIFEGSGEFTITLPDDVRSLPPGKYLLNFHISDDSGDVPEEFELTREFSWGVLAMNFNKAVYAAGEEAYIQMAVLDDVGHVICDSEVTLTIAAPSGAETTLSTEDGTVEKNPECGPESLTDMPDYFAHYSFREEGLHTIEFSSRTAAGEKAIGDAITVGPAGAFDVERLGSTRIFPRAEYGMTIRIESENDFKGDIAEIVPIKFKIIKYDLRITNSADRDPFGSDYKYYEEENGEEKRLVWQDVEILAGDVLEVSYVFDAPDISPELFLVGPLSLAETRLTEGGLSSYSEPRSWQIASDSIIKRARTVQFMAGTFNGAANVGNYTNTDYVMTAFNWRLAESGVDIKNAYVVFESQFEAFNTTGAAYIGYKLGFDACEGSGCASAFGTGNGQVLYDNDNTLVYDDTESNIVRLLLDVTNETQITTYAGNGTSLESQFGYRFKNSSTHISIANASAMLVVTYTYDIDTPSFTNTVIYPLDSTNGTDNGTRQASVGPCTADGGSCPTFAYNMALPEWQGVATTTNRLSQWFKMYENNYLNTTSDIQPILDVQNVNVDSPYLHFESALSANSNPPTMYFPAWSNYGFGENLSQEVEYYASGTPSGALNYIIGGEVIETYIASSSAPVKTRTVSFPMGMITNGNSVALNSKLVTVFFPENGSATGTVDIKSAWVKLSVHGAITSNQYTITTASQVGGNATSSNQVYYFRANTQMMRPTANITYIIPAADYTELEGATATSGKNVIMNLTYSNANFSGASAELMITYTYSSETKGYLSSLQIFGGQSTTSPAIASTLSTANAVFPEKAGKTVLGAALYANFLVSNSATAMDANVHLLDANLSSTTPTCTVAYRALPDSINMSTEMIKDVKSALSTEDDQAYKACYANNNTLLATDGANMSGQLFYTYAWTNSPPTGVFNSASFRPNGSGIADIEIEVNDVDGQSCRGRLEFATGTTCAFLPSGDPLLDETNANVTADFDDPNVENDSLYQIGTADSYIKTASGSNSVLFDWQAKDTLGQVDGTYCLRLTANDLNLDQSAPATTTVYIDTLPPTAPGSLTLNNRTGTTLTLNFGATTTENNFNEYKIFYKLYDGTDPTESDSVWASTSDINLYNKLFNGKATTTITGLIGSTTYSIAIWVYDIYGNKSASARFDAMTNDAPIGVWNTVAIGQKRDGSGRVDLSFDADDANNHDQLKAKIEYVQGAVCNFGSPLDPDLDENPVYVSADFGLPGIENDNEFQIGNTGGWITTSPGANTIGFDWLARQDQPFANDTYCVRLTLDDSFDSQFPSTTTTLVLDNVNPAAPGALSSGGVTTNSITLTYDIAHPSSDTNEPATNAYKVFYKKALAGVTMNDMELDTTDLNAYDYNGATTLNVNTLDQDTWYVFNIWAFDAYGNSTSSIETAVKTNATVNNDSLTLVNARTEGLDSNIIVATEGSEWIFRAVVSEINGWYALASTTLRLANQSDNAAPFSDLVFYWDQTADSFYEIGNDTLSAVSISAGSDSSCAGNSCTLDFRVIFGKNFLATSTIYSAELYSTNDINTSDSDAYTNFYQVRYPFVSQTHYRWRNDDGGE